MNKICKHIYLHEVCTLYRWRDGQTGDGEGPLEGVKEQVLETIKRTFQVSAEQASQLCSELLQCTRKKHLVLICLIKFPFWTIHSFIEFR